VPSTTVIPSGVEGPPPWRPPIIDDAELVLPDDAERPPLPPVRWQYEPPESDEEETAAQAVAPAVEASPLAPAAPAPAPPPSPQPALLEETDDEEALGALEPTAHHDVEPPMTGSSFDAALEALQKRMDRAKLTTDFVRSLLIVDNVIDVGEAAMRWAGMPNKHERSLTSEVFFALAEWGFLAPRADGRYRVLHAADDDPTV
jgi:hypothetical protein